MQISPINQNFQNRNKADNEKKNPIFLLIFRQSNDIVPKLRKSEGIFELKE